MHIVHVASSNNKLLGSNSFLGATNLRLVLSPSRKELPISRLPVANSEKDTSQRRKSFPTSPVRLGQRQGQQRQPSCYQLPGNEEASNLEGKIV
ncbi:hypothetical protein HDV63DRAFT_379292 [Trichoderma sp. SZMC 28014]